MCVCVCARVHTCARMPAHVWLNASAHVHELVGVFMCMISVCKGSYKHSPGRRQLAPMHCFLWGTAAQRLDDLHSCILMHT